MRVRCLVCFMRARESESTSVMRVHMRVSPPGECHYTQQGIHHDPENREGRTWRIGQVRRAVWYMDYAMRCIMNSARRAGLFSR